MNIVRKHLLSLMAVLLAAPTGTSFAQQCDPIETHKLLADDGRAYDNFGHSVAISGTTTIVGCPWHDDRGEMSGSAYLFDITTGQQIKELLVNDGRASDSFGYSVAISADVAIVGASLDDEIGSAYIYRRTGSAWELEEKITASDRAYEDLFGTSVAVDGNVAVVGAGGIAKLAAYVYRWNGSSWQEEQKLIPSGAGNGFGQTVAIDQNCILVGSQYASQNQGNAYFFRWDANRSEWIEEQIVTASDGEPNDLFGTSVSLDGDEAIIGAYWDNALQGSAYIFRWDGNTWNEVQKLTASDGEDHDRFGFSVDLSGATAVVGAFTDRADGSAYLFRRSGDVWMEDSKLIASDGAADDYFGYSVSISLDRAVLGAIWDDDNGIDSGSSYIFDLNCGPTLSTLGSCPGNMRFKVENATANQKVAYLYASNTGSIQIPPGNPCAGTILGLNATVKLAEIIHADANGTAKLDIKTPQKACNRIYLQALDLTTCTTSNTILIQ
ncbi:MAG: hypothetical protein HND57_13115 [Planctomycetes bacterium]|nr:hypothetical protein [Planctomycetota bacterium]